jgi:hypothetical protein
LPPVFIAEPPYVITSCASFIAEPPIFISKATMPISLTPSSFASA